MYALIFDVDGVLGDTEGPICEATRKMFQDLYDVELAPEAFLPYVGTGAVRYVEGPAADCGIEIDTEAALAARHANFAAMLDSGLNIAFPGAQELVDRVAAAPEWILGIATSSPGEKSRLTLEAAGIDVRPFAAWIHGDMITHKKPHPEIYLRAAEALEVSPTACVVVEDAVTGIASAKAAGMKVIGITTSFSAGELAQADHIVNSLHEIDLPLLHQMVAP